MNNRNNKKKSNKGFIVSGCLLYIIFSVPYLKFRKKLLEFKGRGSKLRGIAKLRGIRRVPAFHTSNMNSALK